MAPAVRPRTGAAWCRYPLEHSTACHGPKDRARGQTWCRKTAPESQSAGVQSGRWAGSSTPSLLPDIELGNGANVFSVIFFFFYRNAFPCVHTLKTKGKQVIADFLLQNEFVKLCCVLLKCKKLK